MKTLFKSVEEETEREDANIVHLSEEQFGSSVTVSKDSANMKNKKLLSPDNICTELLKHGGDELNKSIQNNTNDTDKSNNAKRLK